MKPVLGSIMSRIIIGFFLFTLAIAGQAQENDALRQILRGEHRSTEHRARDRYRHPLQTLAFFEVRENMSIVELWPGAAGWYTEILAPLVKEQGKLYAAHFAADTGIPFFQQSLKKFTDKIHSRPEIYGNLILTVLQPPDKLDIAPANSADRILTFRNVHNWMKAGQADLVFRAMFRALQPGGLLGVVEHRNTPGIKQDPQALSGYVSEEYVITLARNAGFELLARSEINANPADTHNHPGGVWTLPPTLRLGEKDRDNYLRIGESDRMTLKFIKPLVQNREIRNLPPE